MKNFRIVLVGQPNVGKSSLINAISGARMKVGNFSGVTVEKAEASLLYGDFAINIIDLPGTYSLNGYTLEEKISKQFLASGEYDVILNVLDSTNLERNLVLTLQLKELGRPMMLALNMIDEAHKDGVIIDVSKLSKLLGFPVVAVSSASNENLSLLMETLCKYYESLNLDSNKVMESISLESSLDSSLDSNSSEFADLPKHKISCPACDTNSSNKKIKVWENPQDSKNIIESNLQDSKDSNKNTESTMQDSMDVTNVTYKKDSLNSDISNGLKNLDSKNTQNSHSQHSYKSIPAQPPTCKIDTNVASANFEKTADSKENIESNLQDSKDSKDVTSVTSKQDSLNSDISNGLQNLDSKDKYLGVTNVTSIKNNQKDSKNLQNLDSKNTNEITESNNLQNLDSRQDSIKEKNNDEFSEISTHKINCGCEPKNNNKIKIFQNNAQNNPNTNQNNINTQNTNETIESNKTQNLDSINKVDVSPLAQHDGNVDSINAQNSNKQPQKIKWQKVPLDTLNKIKMSSKIAISARQIANSVQTLTKTRDTLSEKIDNVLLNRYLAIPIFLFLMFCVFQLTFFVGEFFKGYIEDGIDFLATFAKENIPNATLASLVGDGIIRGVGAPLSFLPLIATLFLGLTILEGSGYMARVAFLLDGIFVRFGLHGKSFIPLVMGFGCSVPAYMATRTLQNKSDRLITMFVIGFMSCSARLPIYLLFVGAFFPASSAGSVLFFIYLGGVVIAMICAKILKMTAFKGSNEPFVMEMPRYRWPSAKVVWFSVWSKCFMFLKKAGSVILLGAIFIWAIATFPHSEEIDSKYDVEIEKLENSQLDSKESMESNNIDSKESIESANLSPTHPVNDIESADPTNDDIESKINSLENAKLQEQLEYSIAGRIGHFLQPFFAPLGFDWRLSVALLTGFSAKEMVVTTLGVLYALGDAANDSESENKALQEVLRKNVSLPSAVAFIVFIMLYIPCFAATIAFTYESGKKIYTLYLFLFTTAVAYFFAYIAHEITRLLM
nr:ferrous iron transport protein B [Helicobacter saguini]